MTPKQWNQLFASGKTARALKLSVAREARTYLITLAPGVQIGTNALVEALYPRAIADQTLEGDIARNGMYKFIGLLAKDGLDDCCVKATEPQGQYMGRPLYPWIWFAPETSECLCPTCGQPVIEGVE